MPKITIDVSEDDYWWLRYRTEGLGLPSVDALIARWIAADNTDEAQLETLRVLLDNGMKSGISDRSMEDIIRENRARSAAA